MVRLAAYLILNSSLLLLSIATELSSPALATPQWVDANRGFNVDLNSIRRVSQGVYQYRFRLNWLKTPNNLHRNYYSYERVDCANQKQAMVLRGSYGDGRMHAYDMRSINLQSTLELPPNEQTPAKRMFVIVCSHIKQNFQQGIVPPELEPDWDLKPESYIQEDEKTSLLP
jgi:hypothetical protein